MARFSKTAHWAPCWIVSALEVRRGVTGAPRCPVVAAYAAAASSWLAGRACGPAPARARACHVAEQ
eukprot:10723138-Lingulodinium_polyedra.AAC.1